MPVLWIRLFDSGLECKASWYMLQGYEEDLSIFLEEADTFLLADKPRKKRRHLKNEYAARSHLPTCCTLM